MVTSTPDPSETVKLRMVIDLQVDDVVDTGISVAEWNAANAGQREKFAEEAWEIAVQQDQGGTVVVTPGAVTL